jgi:integrase/recombinase XerD
MRCRRISVGKKRRKAGRKRRGRSMGRYPFLTLLARYVKEIEGFYAPATVAEAHRKLRKLGWDLRRLKREARIRTDNPLKMGNLEITELLKDMRDRGLSINTVSKQIGQLKVFLDWCGNPVIGNIQKLNKMAIPKQRVHRLSSLTEEEIARVVVAAGSIPGWRGSVASFLMTVYSYCGLRMSELRLAHLEDLDTASWTLRVRHPKGEATWGEKRVVYIPGPARKQVFSFLSARAAMVSKYGLTEEVIPLVPSFSPRGRASFYTAQGIGCVKRAVEKGSGVKFEIRTLRRTYGQLSLDKGMSIDAVSKSMGHSSTKTTETYYCRKSDAMVRAEIDRAWGSGDSSDKARKINSGKNDLIETERYLSGYA